LEQWLTTQIDDEHETSTDAGTGPPPSEPASSSAARRRRSERLARLASRRRLAIMAVGGVAVAVVVGFLGSWIYAPLIGWDVAAATFAVMVWLAVAPMTAAQTADHTNREDPGRAASDVIVLVAAVFSLAAIGVVLVRASGSSQSRDNLIAGLGLVSVALSWCAVHTLFMLRYARLYYAGVIGGIDFKQRARPRYLDFAYVAFTIGMTFQVSDTDLGSSPIRATALRHALLSYLFGAVILAGAINLVIGISTSH
jgi:uncharacterized membrane protein